MLYLVYKTDNLHSFASRDVIGVCSTFKKAVHICNQQSFKEGSPLLSQDVWNLNNLKQTQGYNGDGEFSIEQVAVNQLL